MIEAGGNLGIGNRRSGSLRRAVQIGDDLGEFVFVAWHFLSVWTRSNTGANADESAAPALRLAEARGRMGEAMKARWLGLLLLVAATLSAQRAMTVAQVVTFVGSQVKMKGDDRATADFLLHKVKLTEKLEARVVEELQGQGAGPKTVQALKKLIDESAALPAAPPAETVAAPPPPPPAPSAAEQAEILAAIKDYALNYTNNLPNYMCIQTTRRKIHPTVSGYIPYGDVIREELSFVDHKETYKVLMRNEQSVVNIEHNQLGGAISNGEFGTMLAHIFAPDTGTEFDWDHWATLRGKRM